MKLLLIHPYFKGEKGFGSSSPPTSLGFIGTYVRDYSDCEVEIVDPIPLELSENQVLDKAKESDIIGLTCSTAIRFQCFDFAKKVKQTNPNCKLIVGGSHVISLDKSILGYYPFIDVIVRGEGEETVLDLVKNRPYKEILGITWRNNEKIVQNHDRPFIKDIDSLYCDYSLLPHPSKYGKDIESPKDLRNLTTLPIIPSRGCPFHCTFCAASACWKGTYWGVTPGELIRRMEYLVAQYDIQYFRFFDSLFTANRKRVLKFCDLLKKSEMDIVFKIEARVDVDKEVFEALRKVGCRAISIGLESGSNRVLKRINKCTTRQQIEKTIETLRKLDYWIIGFCMVGLPDETIDEYLKTLELLKYVDLHSFSKMELFPGIPFYDELKRKGEVNDDIWFKEGYGDHVYYVKDMFPSASFYMKDLRWLSQYAFYYHNLHCPKTVFDRYGLLRGLLALSKAVIDIPLKGRIDRIYRALNGVSID